MVGLGGHQDLDDYCDMPVVRLPSLSEVLGDSFLRVDCLMLEN